MVDLLVLIQKIRFVLSFFKLPSLVWNKIVFILRCWKFKRLPRDKKDFLLQVYEGNFEYEKWVHDQNKIFIKCLVIDGFLTHSIKYDKLYNNYGDVTGYKEHHKYMI